MENQTGKQLLEKLKNGTISTEERKLLEDWYDDFVDQSEPFNDVSSFLTDMEILDRAFPFADPEVHTKVYRLWPRIAVAAAVLVVILGAGLFIHYGRLSTDYVANKYEILPGKVGATLTLASGKKIKLSDAANGELAREAGVLIAQTAKGRLVYESDGSESSSNSLNVLATAKGETYQLRLPDGSLVWLNAASSLKYPASFNNSKDRHVELTGEAYFEIAKDKNHPFLVDSKGQTVKVLGTHFNINSYSNEPATATTLMEGSIIFTSGNRSTKLVPGEQILAFNNGTTIKKNVSVDNIVDWQNDEFNFEGVKLKAALRKLERWYNIEFVMDSSISEEMEAGGWISRKNNLSAVLKLISKSGQVKFRIGQDKVYVSSQPK